MGDACSVSLRGINTSSPTAESSERLVAAATPAIAVENVWKVFAASGAGPTRSAREATDRAIALAEQGATRSDIAAATGLTVGVRNVSFDVGRGETFVVMGLSGSGKSTLLRCMSRLVEPTRGAVLVDGADLLAMDEEQLRAVRRSKMSTVFQHFGLFPHRRVIDNVAYGLEVQGIRKSDRHARATEMLEVVGLTGWGQHYPQQLSGGMQQRVGLARALALDPDILFFDEPFSALDPLIRRDMQDELLRLQSVMHCTIVFITHDFAEALRLGDRIAIMKDGVFDQIGTPEEIVAAPATDYVREFTNDVPKSQVLTVRTVMGPVIGGSRRRVGTTDKVASVVPMLLAEDGVGGIDVVDADGVVVGSVDRAKVLALLEAEARPARQSTPDRALWGRA